jgi:hypothetical protein
MLLLQSGTLLTLCHYATSSSSSAATLTVWAYNNRVTDSTANAVLRCDASHHYSQTSHMQYTTATDLVQRANALWKALLLVPLRDPLKVTAEHIHCRRAPIV